LSNRFTVGFYDVVSMMYYRHCQWNKRDERRRNIVATRERLAYVDGLRRHDASAAAECCRAQMAAAQTKRLLRSGFNAGRRPRIGAYSQPGAFEAKGSLRLNSASGVRLLVVTASKATRRPKPLTKFGLRIAARRNGNRP
jgi:hypothetical protein